MTHFLSLEDFKSLEKLVGSSNRVGYYEYLEDRGFRYGRRIRQRRFTMVNGPPKTSPLNPDPLRVSVMGVMRRNAQGGEDQPGVVGNGQSKTCKNQRRFEQGLWRRHAGRSADDPKRAFWNVPKAGYAHATWPRRSAFLYSFDQTVS